jgi:hypothetical protein
MKAPIIESHCSPGRTQHRFACPTCRYSRGACIHCGVKDPDRYRTRCRCEPCAECGERAWRYVYFDRVGRRVAQAKARYGKRVCRSCGQVEREFKVTHPRG